MYIEFKLSFLCNWHSGHSGLSFLAICFHVSVRLALLIALYTVLIVGFAAFTNVNEITSGTINCIITLLFSIAYSRCLNFSSFTVPNFK